MEVYVGEGELFFVNEFFRFGCIFLKLFGNYWIKLFSEWSVKKILVVEVFRDLRLLIKKFIDRKIFEFIFIN